LVAQRIEEQQIASGERAVRVCKKSVLPFELYRWLGEKLLVQRDPTLFAFHILLWNLSYRSEDVARLGARHFAWHGDALCVSLPAVMDHDQPTADTSRRLFANPYNPALSPLLALALFLMCLEESHDSIHLFKSSVAASFQDRVHKLLSSEVCLSECVCVLGGFSQCVE
jgi:hypothetical protein